MPFFGTDWRSPGEQWVRTDFGWKRAADMCNAVMGGARRRSSSSSGKKPLRAVAATSVSVQRARDADDTGDGRPAPTLETPSTGSEQATSRMGGCIHSRTLSMRCVSAQKNSRESSRYVSISDAIQKLSFLQALQDQNCFPFVCKVVALLFKEYSLGVSLQTALVKIIITAKDITVESRQHSGAAVKMVISAISALEKGRRQQFSTLRKQSTDTKIKTLLRARGQILDSGPRQGKFVLSTSRDGSLSPAPDVGLLDLPTDCLRLICSLLSHPRDVVSFGMTNLRLNALVEDDWIWKEMTAYHYNVSLEIPPVPIPDDGHEHHTTLDQHQTSKTIFAANYKASRQKLRVEASDAVALCKVCNGVFWKNYSHPCSAAGRPLEDTLQRLTPEHFLSFFVC